MAKKKKNQANQPLKKTRCFGAITQYYNRPGSGFVQNGQGPYVVFGKTWDLLSQREKPYIKDGDVVIEFEEVARYTIKNVAPSLERVEEKSDAE